MLPREEIVPGVKTVKYNPRESREQSESNALKRTLKKWPVPRKKLLLKSKEAVFL